MTDDIEALKRELHLACRQRYGNDSGADIATVYYIQCQLLDELHRTGRLNTAPVKVNEDIEKEVLEFLQNTNGGRYDDEYIADLAKRFHANLVKAAPATSEDRQRALGIVYQECWDDDAEVSYIRIAPSVFRRMQAALISPDVPHVPAAYLHECDYGSSLFHAKVLAEQKQAEFGGEVKPLYLAPPAPSVTVPLIEGLREAVEYWTKHNVTGGGIGELLEAARWYADNMEGE